ncbi:MAG: hypothetical protein O3B41_07115, partial [Bacteroidetes bacterium]|nr:hypothetical protein [Bacteroidota bacterium]
MINEILPAPSGANFEFIELIFDGESSIVPGDISLRDNSINWSPVRFERPLTALDTLVLVRSLGEAQDLINAGIAVGTLSPWPTLNNGGDSLFVRLGATLQDKMGYSSSTSNLSWERKAPYLPSQSPSSWMLSKSASGASPGRTNSVFTRDLVAPRLLGAEYRDDRRIVAWFSEPMPDHTEILGEIGTGTEVTESARSIPFENRITLELHGRSAPEWLKVNYFIDYAGNVGTPSSVPIALPPEEGELFFSEVHFMEGGSSLASGAPEFFELYGTSKKSLSLYKTSVAFRGSQYALFHPDSMAILPPSGTFLAAAKPWPSWEELRQGNDLWLLANQPNPFKPSNETSALPLLGLAPWISFKNEGESLGLWVDGLQFDTVVFDQSCFDARFTEHRGRSLRRIFYQTDDLKITVNPTWGHLVRDFPPAPASCLWASTLFDSGISPGSVTGPILRTKPPIPGSLLVTEVMYDPIAASADFVYDQVEFIEFINVSAEPVQLQDLWLADDPDEEGLFDQIRLVSSPVTLFPGQIAVLFHFPSSFPDESFREHQVLAKAWPGAAGAWAEAAGAWPGAAGAWAEAAG